MVFFVMMILLVLWFSLSMWLTCCMSESDSVLFVMMSL
jgi:hypothetical protein